MSPRKLRVVTIMGTRPEAVKLAPVVRALKRRPGVEAPVWVTGQHREMLDPFLRFFGLRPGVDLDLMRPGQSLEGFASRAISSLTQALHRGRPDLVVVQGDTTTTFVASLAAFYAGAPVGHVEAGLRTGDKRSPFPEEMNRRLTTVLADLHFAPTRRARENLLAEGVSAASVFLTGNPVTDALRAILERPLPDPLAGKLPPGRKMILVTAHRRESFGAPMLEICRALREIVERHPEVELVYPVHLNPRVREPVGRILSGVPRIHLLPPLGYAEFVHLMKRAELIISDSGGVQEEAPFLGKPVLVLREKTERPEAVEAGCALLVGSDRARIVREADRVLRDPKVLRPRGSTRRLFGDGRAGEKIAAIVVRWRRRRGTGPRLK